MIGLFRQAIRRYGRVAVCRDESGGELGRAMAILRPITAQERLRTGTSLGGWNTGRALGLAETSLPVDRLGPGGWLEWGGRRFEVTACRPIPLGEGISHLWLALRLRGESAP